MDNTDGRRYDTVVVPLSCGELVISDVAAPRKFEVD